VDCPANGNEGLEKVTHILFDLIVLDAALPPEGSLVLEMLPPRLLRESVQETQAAESNSEVRKRISGSLLANPALSYLEVACPLLFLRTPRSDHAFDIPRV